MIEWVKMYLTGSEEEKLAQHYEEERGKRHLLPLFSSTFFIPLLFPDSLSVSFVCQTDPLCSFFAQS